jgi:hypothetical protein
MTTKTSPARRRKTRATPKGNVEIVPVKPSLDELATTANMAHEGVRQAGISMVKYALDAGQALNEAKAQLRRGEWGKWLAEHFSGSADTAELYMRIARNRKAVRDLKEPSLRNALNAVKALTPPKPKPKKQTTDDDEDPELPTYLSPTGGKPWRLFNEYLALVGVEEATHGIEELLQAAKEAHAEEPA